MSTKPLKLSLDQFLQRLLNNSSSSSSIHNNNRLKTLKTLNSINNNHHLNIISNEITTINDKLEEAVIIRTKVVLKIKATTDSKDNTTDKATLGRNLPLRARLWWLCVGTLYIFRYFPTMLTTQEGMTFYDNSNYACMSYTL